MRLRSVVLGAAVALAALAPVMVPAATGAAAACAATPDGPHAGLVVDTGGHATSYCVSLDASAVSGIHLIQLAGEQYGLQYRLGFGGQAVCQLGGVGPDGDDCFADYPSFWGYWHGSGDGGWAWATSGAASAMISDGERDGWSWGTGDSGSSHAPPPAESIGRICPASSPSPTPSPTPTHGGGSGGGQHGSGSGSQGTKASTPPPSAGPEKSAKAGASPRKSAAPSPTAAGTSAADPGGRRRGRRRRLEWRTARSERRWRSGPSWSSWPPAHCASARAREGLREGPAASRGVDHVGHLRGDGRFHDHQPLLSGNVVAVAWFVYATADSAARARARFARSPSAA